MPEREKEQGDEGRSINAAPNLSKCPHGGKVSYTIDDFNALHEYFINVRNIYLDYDNYIS